MFIDFVTLMLVNMSAGLCLLAFFVFSAKETLDKPWWAPAFAIVGSVACICGFYMTFTFPLIGPYNIAFGEMSILLGMLFLGAAWSLAKSWSIAPLAIYSFLAGSAAMLVGIAFIRFGLSKTPVLTGIGFILTGLVGVLWGPVLQFRPLRLLIMITV